MKGIVFTELIEMVEENLGIEMADRMIEGANTSTAEPIRPLEPMTMPI